MYICAWCKIDIESYYIRTEYSEPLCEKCKNRYNFAIDKNMVNKPIAEMSKKHRRNISILYNTESNFLEGMYSIDRTEITGWRKIILKAIIITLSITLFIVFYYLFSGVENNGINKFFLVPVMIIGFGFVILLSKINNLIMWVLCFYQLKRQTKYKIGIYEKKED